MVFVDVFLTISCELTSLSSILGILAIFLKSEERVHAYVYLQFFKYYVTDEHCVRVVHSVEELIDSWGDRNTNVY